MPVWYGFLMLFMASQDYGYSHHGPLHPIREIRVLICQGTPKELAKHVKDTTFTENAVIRQGNTHSFGGQ